MIIPKAELTPSGRPQLAQGEVERAMLDKVDVEFEGSGRVDGGQPASRYQGGYAIVTSHRLFWIDAESAPQPGRSCVLPLASLGGASKRVQYTLNVMNPKVRVELRVHVNAELRPCGASESFKFVAMALRCRGPAPDAFLDNVTAALAAHQRLLQQQMQAAAQQALQQGQGGGSHVSVIGGAGGSRVGTVPGGGGASDAAPVARASDVDASYLQAIMDMGFPRNRAVRALVATRNEGVQQALDWILAYGDTPGVDDPLEGEGPPQQQQGPAAAEQQRPGAAAAAGVGGGGMYPPAPGGASIAEARRQWQQQQQSSVSLAPPRSQSPGGASLSAPSASSSSASFNNPLLQPGGPWRGPASVSGSSVSVNASGGSGVGVAGLMAREQVKAASAGRALDAAFSDLRALMDAAAEMVELAERFRAQGGGSSGGGAGSAGSSATGEASAAGGDAVLDPATAAALAAMGIVSPVTRASAGALYHQQLARQLSDFLEGPLRKAGGLMMLPDVYCLFNRARGTELVSPDDLLTACELLEGLGLPLRLRRFASGVIVVQGAGHTDAALAQAIAKMVAADGGGAEQQLGAALSASAVGMALGLPVALAKEALLVAEAAGVLCRDDGPEGLRFFKNFFADAAAGAAAAALLAGPVAAS